MSEAEKKELRKRIREILLELQDVCSGFERAISHLSEAQGNIEDLIFSLLAQSELQEPDTEPEGTV